MPVYSVTYDLRKQGQDYDGLIKKLESLNSVKYQKSAWLVESAHSSTGLKGLIDPFIDQNDLLLIIEVKQGFTGQLIPERWPEIRSLFK